MRMLYSNMCMQCIWIQYGGYCVQYLDTVYRISISVYSMRWYINIWGSMHAVYLDTVWEYCIQISVYSVYWYINIWGSMHAVCLDTVWNIVSKYLYIVCVGISMSDIDIDIDIVLYCIVLYCIVRYSRSS